MAVARPVLGAGRGVAGGFVTLPRKRSGERASHRVAKWGLCSPLSAPILAARISAPGLRCLHGDDRRGFPGEGCDGRPGDRRHRLRSPEQFEGRRGDHRPHARAGVPHGASGHAQRARRRGRRRPGAAPPDQADAAGAAWRRARWGRRWAWACRAFAGCDAPADGEVGRAGRDRPA